jgi:hypothetical protein
MSRKSRQRKKRHLREAKKREKENVEVRVSRHRCAFLRTGCAGCPHAAHHLVEVHEDMKACAGFCMHHDIDVYCVPVRGILDGY